MHDDAPSINNLCAIFIVKKKIHVGGRQHENNQSGHLECYLNNDRVKT